MNRETLEQVASDYSQNEVEISDGLIESLQNKHVDELFSVIRNTFIEGAAWREQQAASGYDEWAIKEDRHDGLFSNANNYTRDEYFARNGWQASALHSAKLLAEKDKEIEENQESLAWQNNKLSQAKEIIKQIKSFNEFRNPDMTLAYLSAYLKRNTEQIKALLGEE